MAIRPLLALSAVFLFGAFSACGGDDAGATDIDLEPTSASTTEPPPVTTSTAAVNTNTDVEPALDGPVSRFAISQADLGKGYLTDVQQTFRLTQEDYAGTTLFGSTAEGMALLTEWGYIEGYETGYEPEGRTQAVLNGSYYISLEVHLFESPEGARAAYDFFEQRLRSTSSNVNAPSVGNRSSAWRLVAGTVPGSSVEGTYHRVVTRRGNLVSVVLTWGADPFMTIDHAMKWALLVDAKALGEVETTEPTPTSNFNPNQ